MNPRVRNEAIGIDLRCYSCSLERIRSKTDLDICPKFLPQMVSSESKSHWSGAVRHVPLRRVISSIAIEPRFPFAHEPSMTTYEKEMLVQFDRGVRERDPTLNDVGLLDDEYRLT